MVIVEGRLRAYGFGTSWLFCGFRALGFGLRIVFVIFGA